jgi:hypothetical protein
MASWSQMYGMTDDVTPMPIPAPRSAGSLSAGPAAGASGMIATAAASIAPARPSRPAMAGLCATLWAATM